MKKISNLQLILTTVFITSLLISNIITVKQIMLPFGISVTGGVIVFPITYILSDLFSEVYGYKWSRLTCYLAFAMNLFMAVMFGAIIAMPAPDYWNEQSSLVTILGNTPRILVASLISFVIGDFVNDNIYEKLKGKHLNDCKGFGFRAIISSVFGNLIDSTTFLFIAFAGVMPIKNIVLTLIFESSFKTIFEIIVLPLTTLTVRKVFYYEKQSELG